MSQGIISYSPLFNSNCAHDCQGVTMDDSSLARTQETKFVIDRTAGPQPLTHIAEAFRHYNQNHIPARLIDTPKITFVERGAVFDLFPSEIAQITEEDVEQRISTVAVNTHPEAGNYVPLRKAALQETIRDVVKYAVFSYRWTDSEPSYQDVAASAASGGIKECNAKTVPDSPSSRSSARRHVRWGTNSSGPIRVISTRPIQSNSARRFTRCSSGMPTPTSVSSTLPPRPQHWQILSANCGISAVERCKSSWPPGGSSFTTKHGVRSRPSPTIKATIAHVCPVDCHWDTSGRHRRRHQSRHQRPWYLGNHVLGLKAKDHPDRRHRLLPTRSRRETTRGTPLRGAGRHLGGIWRCRACQHAIRSGTRRW
ncbi:hypothetical protein HD554DRAFT_673964 [Boletus coccyginus]|nr:hypothetical protein HD554DRAFT_673964 [Boletus coccyginus]